MHALTDRHTDSVLIAKLRLHCMQRGNNSRLASWTPSRIYQMLSDARVATLQFDKDDFRNTKISRKAL